MNPQRYQTGEDREELAKANRTLSEEEEKKMKDGSTVVVEGVKRTIEDVINRKKLKQSYEYGQSTFPCRSFHPRVEG